MGYMATALSLLSGYVQGMSDLLSPILYVMENEVDAFWCFVSFMDQMVSFSIRAKGLALAFLVLELKMIVHVYGF